MSQLSSEKEKALRAILLDYANNEATTAWEAISAILGVVGQDTGMTLRDQFAMAALSGMLANGRRNGEVSQFPKAAYLYADYMMEARK